MFFLSPFFARRACYNPPCPQKPAPQNTHPYLLPGLFHALDFLPSSTAPGLLSPARHPSHSLSKPELPSSPNFQDMPTLGTGLPCAIRHLGLFLPQSTRNPTPPPTETFLLQERSPQCPGPCPLITHCCFPPHPPSSTFFTLRSTQSSTFLLRNSSVLLSAAGIAQSVLAADCW